MWAWWFARVRPSVRACTHTDHVRLVRGCASRVRPQRRSCEVRAWQRPHTTTHPTLSRSRSPPSLPPYLPPSLPLSLSLCLSVSLSLALSLSCSLSLSLSRCLDLSGGSRSVQSDGRRRRSGSRLSVNPTADYYHIASLQCGSETLGGVGNSLLTCGSSQCNLNQNNQRQLTADWPIRSFIHSFVHSFIPVTCSLAFARCVGTLVATTVATTRSYSTPLKLLVDRLQAVSLRLVATAAACSGPCCDELTSDRGTRVRKMKWQRPQHRQYCKSSSANSSTINNSSTCSSNYQRQLSQY
jgi:hypothetical protein